eukprot:1194401-Prorocentrum_minimum.AAC.4
MASQLPLCVNSSKVHNSLVQVQVKALPPHVVRLDMSEAAAASYNVMEWLKEQAPQFTAVHFFAPHFAHYASLARQQGLALTRTPLVAHFLTTAAAKGWGPRASPLFKRCTTHLEDAILHLFRVTEAYVAAAALQVARGRTRIGDLPQLEVGSP